jgi:predicted metalloprotease with PDZ domain
MASRKSSYRITGDRRSVTSNWVSEDLVVLNGAPTFLTLVEPGDRPRPHDVRLELPAKCRRSISALPAPPHGGPNDYRAADYDTLVDSPIVAGDLSIHEFEVEGSQHLLADAGAIGPWDGARAAGDLEKIVRATRRFWGFLPFRRYVFLNVFRAGAGGLEHKDSTLLTANPARGARAGIPPVALVRQPRVFPRVQRQAVAPGGAGTVRLRAPAVDQEPVDRRGSHDLLR